MGAVIVHHQVQWSLAGELTVNTTEKLQELLMAVALMTVADDLALEQIQGGKQRSGAIPLVVMRHRAAAPFLDGQARLGSI